MNKFKQDDVERIRELLYGNESVDDKADEFFTSKPTHSQSQAKRHDEHTESDIDVAEVVKKSVNKLATKLARFYIKSVKPTVNTLKPKLTRTFKNVVVAIGPVRVAIGTVGMLFIILAFGLISGTTDQKNDSPDVQGVSVAPEIAEPTFETIAAPENVQARFDQARQVASFQDTLAGSPVVVSQQQVPDNEKSNELFLLKVAQSFGISKEFQSDKGGVFIGDNQEQQVQTALFRYKDLLVFIQTESIYPNDVLVEYINSL